MAQANVMLEYTVEDAKALLTKNADNARSNVKVLDEDLVFLRDQIVTTEVSIRFRRVSLVLLSSCGAGTERGGGGWPYAERSTRGTSTRGRLHADLALTWAPDLPSQTLLGCTTGTSSSDGFSVPGRHDPSCVYAASLTCIHTGSSPLSCPADFSAARDDAPVERGARVHAL